MAAEQVSTGIDAIDRQLGGGVRTGSVVAMSAPLGSQSETIIKTFMRERPTVYVSTVRNETVVRDELDRAGQRSGQVTIEYAGVTDPIEEARSVLAQVDGAINLVIDPVSPLERTDDPSHYVEFLNELKVHLTQTGSVAMLHCPTDGDRPANREYTFSIADLVWELEVEKEGAYLENKLVIPKNRENDQVDDIITVQLGRDVTVDLSRDIA
jgi:KaiC/GvpD/RAD55 family RecA-like ATPase